MPRRRPLPQIWKGQTESSPDGGPCQRQRAFSCNTTMPSSSPDDTPTAPPNEAFRPPDVEANLARLELQVCFARRRHQLYHATPSAVGTTQAVELTSRARLRPPDADHLAGPRFSQRRAGRDPCSPSELIQMRFAGIRKCSCRAGTGTSSLQSDDVSGWTTQAATRTRCSSTENLDATESQGAPRLLAKPPLFLLTKSHQLGTTPRSVDLPTTHKVGEVLTKLKGATDLVGVVLGRMRGWKSERLVWFGASMGARWTGLGEGSAGLADPTLEPAIYALHRAPPCLAWLFNPTPSQPLIWPFLGTLPSLIDVANMLEAAHRTPPCLTRLFNPLFNEPNPRSAAAAQFYRAASAFLASLLAPRNFEPERQSTRA
ncbi:hypothetical protein HMN09_00871900 [Mycena chlorophos]|uniref:Uncharacterized protein n=1 Tax=Mycena chlorophos TaxID=658473 RepID=A0A8H6SQ83_MYCCL|nr:hypothetical protein HMN09_00871900 [Mycena chlorophos]